MPAVNGEGAKCILFVKIYETNRKQKQEHTTATNFYPSLIPKQYDRSEMNRNHHYTKAVRKPRLGYPNIDKLKPTVVVAGKTTATRNYFQQTTEPPPNGDKCKPLLYAHAENRQKKKKVAIAAKELASETRNKHDFNV